MEKTLATKKTILNSHTDVQEYYNEVYYGEKGLDTISNRHLRWLASKLQIQSGHHVLDIACGNGQWLAIVAEKGSQVAGVDISDKAIAVCQKRIPAGSFFSGPAETLPFSDHVFDVITCLGSLEHFLQPEQALNEMLRVAKPQGFIVFSVPIAGFWLSRLKLFRGTAQRTIQEQVLSRQDWEKLFYRNGLIVTDIWPDWHIIDWQWVGARSWLAIPIRGLIALSLLICPLDFQYQLYFHCRIK